MSKALTKDCSSCKLLIVEDDNEFFCLWGKSKKKRLIEGKGKIKKCNLLNKGERSEEKKQKYLKSK